MTGEDGPAGTGRSANTTATDSPSVRCLTKTDASYNMTQQLLTELSLTCLYSTV